MKASKQTIAGFFTTSLYPLAAHSTFSDDSFASNILGSTLHIRAVLTTIDALNSLIQRTIIQKSSCKVVA